MTLLQRLRKRRATIARVVAPLVATVWFSASASACVGMAADAGGAHRADAGRSEAARHAVGHTSPQHDDSHTTPAHDHSHAAPQHEHSDAALRHAAGPPGDSRPACPHCPEGAWAQDRPAAHVACATLDAVANGAAAAHFAEPDVKFVLPAAAALPAPPLIAPARAVVRAPPLERAAVAVHLRHCVFLI